jgi:hypothetical protein
MTVEAALPAQGQSGSVALETGRQTSRRHSFEDIGLILAILVILLLVTLAVGVTPPGA